MNLQEWIADVEGRVIGSGQCVGLAQDYSTRVVGGGFTATDVGPYPGYAGNMWTSNIPGFTRASKHETMMPGWVPIWGKGPFTPATHVAVGIADAGLGVDCMTQNPGAAKRQIIPKAALLGYLVPSKDVGSGGGSIRTVNSAGDIVEGVKTVSALNDLKEWVSDGGNWQRVGLYALGFLLVVFAVVYLFRNKSMTLVKEALK